ncbi:PilZ domain-containing protein [Porticoccaceae bacterium LTM1]|nr:PilZ domain-containing protein [Porticoccaceae bacterium LTM1]
MKTMAVDSLGGGVRNGILNLKLMTEDELYQSYMPFVVNGGLFIPTRQSYLLGDEVFVLLQLMDEPEKIPITGKVVWVTPKETAGSRRQGIGIQLGEANSDLVGKIEAYLAGMIQSGDRTHTM